MVDELFCPRQGGLAERPRRRGSFSEETLTGLNEGAPSVASPDLLAERRSSSQMDWELRARAVEDLCFPDFREVDDKTLKERPNH